MVYGNGRTSVGGPWRNEENGDPQETNPRVMDSNTYKGRINIGITRMKQLFPDKQIHSADSVASCVCQFRRNERAAG